MGNFQGGGDRGGNRGGGFRGPGGGGGKPPFKKSWGGSDRDKTSFKAICSECNKNCEVPFRPSGDKPVYCSDCFKSKRDDGDRGPRKDFGDRGPQKSFDRPSFRSDSKPEFKPAQTSDNTGKQLAEINTKLDRLINALEKMTETKKVVSVKKAVAPKVAKKKAVPTGRQVVAKKKK